MKKLISAVLVSTLAVATMTGCGGKTGATGADAAASFPEKTMNLTVAYNAGGGTDLSARAFAEVAPEYFNNQSFTVSNVAGGGGATWYSQGGKQTPDGYNATVVTVEVITLPILQDVAFSTEDYKFIARMNFPAAAITVPTNSPYNTLEEFLAAAKANPGTIRIGNSGVNAIWDLHTYALEQQTGTSFNHIPYEGAAPAVKALMSGEIDAVAVSAAEVSSQVLDGTFKILAVASPERLEAFPEAPTYDELGIEMPYIGGWRGIAVPKDTPDEIVAVYREKAAEVINSDKFKELMKTQNLTVDYLSGEDFEKFISDQQVFFADLIEKLNLKQ